MRHKVEASDSASKDRMRTRHGVLRNCGHSPEEEALPFCKTFEIACAISHRPRGGECPIVSFDLLGKHIGPLLSSLQGLSS